MWFEVKNISEVDSPAIVVFKERIAHNIELLVRTIDEVNRLRPHIKTHKSKEVCIMMIERGITKFKCATIAEAEILGQSGARDILLAYQPVGPKVQRFKRLVEEYPGSTFSCLLDNESSAHELANVFSEHQPANYFIDLNVGMNRTGIVPDQVVDLFLRLNNNRKQLHLRGLHAYDGHLRNPDINIRKKECDAAFAPVLPLLEKLEQLSGRSLTVVAGGSPTYPVHAQRKEVECSPGTFIYWDKGYESILPEQKFIHAAIVVTRVISLPAPGVVCIDLGHKAIASENPLSQRITFLNGPGLEPVGHSEEHMVLKNTGSIEYQVGDVLYGVPFHVCPTIALHDSVKVAVAGNVREIWQTLSRNRTVTV